MLLNTPILGILPPRHVLQQNHYFISVFVTKEPLEKNPYTFFSFSLQYYFYFGFCSTMQNSKDYRSRHLSISSEIWETASDVKKLKEKNTWLHFHLESSLFDPPVREFRNKANPIEIILCNNRSNLLR